MDARSVRAPDGLGYATVRAVNAWILRLDPAWQLVAIVGVAGASALAAATPSASVERRNP